MILVHSNIDREEKVYEIDCIIEVDNDLFKISKYTNITQNVVFCECLHNTPRVILCRYSPISLEDFLSLLGNNEIIFQDNKSSQTLIPYLKR